MYADLPKIHIGYFSSCPFLRQKKFQEDFLLKSIKCLISFCCGGCRIVHLSSLRHIALKLVVLLLGSYECMHSLVKINVLYCNSLSSQYGYSSCIADLTTSKQFSKDGKGKCTYS